MTLDSPGAVLLLELRVDEADRRARPELIERVLSRGKVLLEAPAPGQRWSPAGEAALSGTLTLEDAARAVPLLHRLRLELRSDPADPAVVLAAGLGRGEEIAAAKLASAAFRLVGRRGRLFTCALTEDEETNVLLGALCGTLDTLQAGWTRAQWQAVHRRERGGTLQEIGRDLGIAYQNVSKRLIAAHYPLYCEVLEAASMVFSKAPPGRF